MKLRELPGALILGLLASLLAHAASYGGAHPTGGVFHATILTLALAGALGFALILGLAAWFHGRRLAEGSIVASRLAPLLPNPSTVGVFASINFFTIEALEGRHAQAPGLLILVALILASVALNKLAHLFVRAIAHVVFALVSRPFAARRPAYLRRLIAAARVSGTRHGYRRFARPPPWIQLASPVAPSAL